MQRKILVQQFGGAFGFRDQQGFGVFEKLRLHGVGVGGEPAVALLAVDGRDEDLAVDLHAAPLRWVCREGQRGEPRPEGCIVDGGFGE